MLKLVKIDIVYKVSHQAGLSTVEAVDAVNAVLSTVKSGLVGDGVVHLRGFGTFHRRQRWARMARNPKNGEPHLITARSVVRFKPSRVLRQVVNGGRP